jgi:hypothetical protein
MDRDDPEARIRELEVGSYTENPGTASYSLPPPMPAQYVPPPQYGPPAQYGGPGTYVPQPGFGPPVAQPFQRGRSRRRVARLITFGFVAVAMLSILWDAAGTQLQGLVGDITSSTVTVEKGGNISLGGNSETHEIACNGGGTVTASGNSGTFTITGHCERLNVSGNDTRVTIDSVDVIDAGGIDTVTTYHSGSPKINRTGIDVTVQRG